ncbi:MAG: outer membrane beta-barrel family protein, partial [Algoriella sp.]
PSEDVKKIEVITSPSAKYEAEGNSGLINIITKKKNNDLFSGNYSTSFTKNSKESFGNNLGLNFNKNKFQSSIRFRHSDRKAKVYENQNLLYANGDQLNNNANREDHSKNYGINADLSYKTSSRNTLGIIYDYANNKSQYVNVNKTSYYTVNVLDSLLTTNSTYNNPSEIHTINLYDDLLLDTIGTKLSFVANYFDNKPSTTLDFVTDNQQNTNLMKIINTSFIRHKVYSGQIDLFKPMKWATFETGIKYTRFDNNSDIKYYDFINNDYLLNPNQSNNFGVIEDNYAAYLSMNKKIDKWTFKAGLRYEYTDLETQDNFKIKYGKLFPNFNLMYKIDNNTYTINYNKRINRPRLSQLNPFRWYSNPFTYNVGNPYLQPSISHNIEFNYLYKGIFMASLFGSRQEDAFSALINITEGIKETKYDNVFKTNNIGVNLSFEKDLFKFWNLSINASTFYSESESKYSEIETLNGWSTSYTINNAFTLLKKNNWIASLDFNHILPGKESNIQSNSYYFLSLGSRISLMENKLTLTARVNDMLKGSKTRGKMYYQDFSQSYNNYYDNRFFTIGINYNFGLIKNSRRNVQFNEQYRAN